MLENLVRFKRIPPRELSSLPSKIQVRMDPIEVKGVLEKSSLDSSDVKKDEGKSKVGKLGEGEGNEGEGVSLSLFDGKGGDNDGFDGSGRPKCVPLSIWKDILHSVLIKFWDDGSLRNSKSSAFSILSHMEEEIYLALSVCCPFHSRWYDPFSSFNEYECVCLWIIRMKRDHQCWIHCQRSRKKSDLMPRLRC
jgi:hypothetical protein